MTPFEEALGAGGDLVAAWDLADAEQLRLVLFSVGLKGAERLAETDVPRATHEDMVDRLVDRAVRIGATYADTSVVWVTDDHGFVVWSGEAQTASGRIASHAVASVQVFGDRGVRLKLKSGGHDVIAEEPSGPALWAPFLGEHLAIWHLVALENESEPALIDERLAIAYTARGLAKDIEKNNAPIAQLVHAIGPIGPSTMLSFVVSDTENATLLAIRVTMPGGATPLEAVVKRGTRVQIAAYLRRVTTPAAVQGAMLDAIAHDEHAS